MVVGRHHSVLPRLPAAGVRQHDAREGERPAQHVGPHEPPLQEEQRLAAEEQTGF